MGAPINYELIQLKCWYSKHFYSDSLLSIYIAIVNRKSQAGVSVRATEYSFSNSHTIQILKKYIWIHLHSTISDLEISGIACQRRLKTHFGDLEKLCFIFSFWHPCIATGLLKYQLTTQCPYIRLDLLQYNSASQLGLAKENLPWTRKTLQLICWPIYQPMVYGIQYKNIPLKLRWRWSSNYSHTHQPTFSSSQSWLTFRFSATANSALGENLIWQLTHKSAEKSDGINLRQVKKLCYSPFSPSAAPHWMAALLLYNTKDFPTQNIPICWFLHEGGWQMIVNYTHILPATFSGKCDLHPIGTGGGYWTVLTAPSTYYIPWDQQRWQYGGRKLFHILFFFKVCTWQMFTLSGSKDYI